MEVYSQEPGIQVGSAHNSISSQCECRGQIVVCTVVSV